MAALTLSACGDENTQRSPGSPVPRPADQIDQSVQRFLNETLPEGASGTVLAARHGQLVHCEGFGMADLDAKVPAQCDTVYDIGSMTKQFTAAAILKLEMMGQLRVTDPISKWIGSVPDDKRDITLHQLLTHTAGLTEQLGDDYAALSREDMLLGALKSPLRSAPGTEYRYSNLGYSILAAIIEEASGTGYEEFLTEQLFAPAGMTQTGYVLPEWNPDRVAVEYDKQGKPKGRPFDHPWAEDGPHWNLRGNGGLLSTARDMFRWHIALEGDEILTKSAKDKLFTPHVLEEEEGDTYYGYGWVVMSRTDGRIVWHDGGNGWSFGVYTRFLDQGVMVFLISNHAYRDGGWDLEELASELTLGVSRRVRR